MLIPAAPALTAETIPGPGVEVYFASIDALATTITVWRTADGETEAVAGALRATVAGDFVVTDWGVPFGVVSSYTAEIFDAGGAAVTGLPASITVNSDEVVFTNPTDPEQSFTVELQAASLDMVGRTTRTQTTYVMGIRRPFTQFLGEGALEGVPLEIWSRTPQETINMNSLTSVGVWLIRTPPKFATLPRLLYVVVKQPRHKYLDLSTDDRPVVWTMTVDETQPGSKAIIRPLITWDDWETAFPGGIALWDGTVGLSASRTPANMVLVQNLVPNPSGEVATTGFTAVPGTTGAAAVTNPAATTAFGAKVLKTTWSTASTAAGGGVYIDVPVVAASVYSFGVGHVKSSIGNRLQLSVEWRTSSATISSVTATAVQVTAGTIYSALLENQTAPALATVARIKVLSVTGTGYANWSISSYLEIDGLIASPGATTAPYFEGGQVVGFTWDAVLAIYAAGTWTDAVRNPPV